MKRIKSLLFLFAFLLGVSAIQAQTLVEPQILKAPTPADLDPSLVDLKMSQWVDGTGKLPTVVYTGCGEEQEMEIIVNLNGPTGVYPAGDYAGGPQTLDLGFKLWYFTWDQAVALGVDLTGYTASTFPGKNILSLDPAGVVANKDGEDYFQRNVSGTEDNPYNSNAYIQFEEGIFPNAGIGTAYYVLEGYRVIGDTPATLDAMIQPFYTIVKVDVQPAFEVEVNNAWEMVYGLDKPVVYENVTVGGDFVESDCALKIVKKSGLDCSQEFYVEVSYVGPASGTDIDVLALGATKMTFGPYTTMGCQELNCDMLKVASKLGSGTYGASLFIDNGGVKSPLTAKPVEFKINSKYGFGLDMKDMDLVYRAGPILPEDGQFCITGPTTSSCNDPENYVVYLEVKRKGTTSSSYGTDVINLGSSTWNIKDDACGKYTALPVTGECHDMAPGEYRDVYKEPSGFLKNEAIRYGTGNYTAQLVYCRGGVKTYASEPVDFQINGLPPITIEDIEPINVCKDPVCPAPLSIEFDIANLMTVVKNNASSTKVWLRIEKVSGDNVLYNSSLNLIIIELDAPTALGNKVQEVTVQNFDGILVKSGGEPNKITVDFSTYALGTGKYKVTIYETEVGAKGNLYSLYSPVHALRLSDSKEFDVTVTCCDFNPEDLKITGKAGDLADAIMDLVLSQDINNILDLADVVLGLVNIDEIPEGLTDVIRDLSNAMQGINLDESHLYQAVIKMLNVIDLYGLIPEKVCIGSPFANLYIPMFTTYKGGLVCPFGSTYALVHVDGDAIIDFSSIPGGTVSADGKVLYIKNNFDLSTITGGAIGSIGLLPGNPYFFTTTLTTEGKGTYQFVPIVGDGLNATISWTGSLYDALKNCGEGLEGTPTKAFTIDVRKPLSADMLAHTDEVFYRTNGSDPFGPIALTNESLPKKGNPVLDLIIYDIEDVVSHIEDYSVLTQYNPFLFDGAMVYPMIGLPVGEDGTIKMPKIVLKNETNVQQPLKVGYSLRYEDGYYCCEGEEGFPWANIIDMLSGESLLDAIMNVVNDRVEGIHKNWIWGCASGSFYVVVKPLDNATNMDLVAIPVQVAPICSDGEFNAQFGAKYHEKDIFENGEALPTGVSVTYRVNWFEGDEIVDLTNGKNLVGTDGIWTPSAVKAGKGIYTVTPVFSENMTLSNGVPVSFVLEVREGLTEDMIAIAGKEFEFTNGQLVPAIMLETTAPANANITWEVVVEGDYVNVGTLTSGMNIVPAFYASNNGFEPVESKIKVTLSYGNGDEDNGCEDVITYFTIKVKPAVLNKDALIVNHIDGMNICGIEGQTEFDITATYQNAAAPEDYTTYRVVFVGGVDVATFDNDGMTWTATAKAVGTGTYQIIPTLLGVDGIPSTFTVEVREALTVEMIGLDSKEFNYTNGQLVPAIALENNGPAGTTLYWEVVANLGSEPGSNPVYVGTIAGGIGSIPAFYADNNTMETITSTIKVTLAYGQGDEDNECEDVITHFTIKVKPAVLNKDALVVDQIEGTVICAVGGEYPFEVNGTYQGNEAPEGTTYRVEFVSGVDVATITFTEEDGWVAVGKQKGFGTYQIIPTLLGVDGVPAIFTIEVHEALSADMIAIVKDQVFNYTNGDLVPAINLDNKIPADARLSWVTVLNEAGLVNVGTLTAGTNTIPAFYASNNTMEMVTSKIRVYLSYGDGNEDTGCDVVTVDFTINVAPAVLNKDALIAASVAGTTLCFGGGTYEINPTATYQGYAAPAKTTYSIEFVSGKDVVTLAEVSGVWTATAKSVGVGTYQVVPTLLGVRGIPATFTIEVLASLDSTMVALNNTTLTYKNGDVVPAIDLDANLPEGVVVSWTKKDAVAVGSAASGNETIPGFVATNITGEAITSEYEFVIKYQNGNVCGTATGKFYIQVLPNTIFSSDLTMNGIEDQIVCGGSEFTAVTLTAQHKFVAGLEGVTFEYALVGGVNVLGGLERGLASSPWSLAAAADAAMEGTGIYEVTPFWHNFAGVPVQFSLTRLAAPQVNDIADQVLCNGEGLNVTFTSKHADTEFDWAITTANHKLVGVTNSGSGAINFAAVSHSEATPQAITITVTPRNPNQLLDCEGEDKTFIVTVNPVVTMNAIANRPVEHGKVVDDIKFVGTATSYKWTSENPAIYENYEGFASGTVVADGNGVAYFPAFTAANYTKDVIASKVIVTPYYGDCPGQSVQFYILVTSETEGISLEHKADLEACHGEVVAPISFGLPTSSYYFITWTSDVNIGLANSAEGARNKSFPQFTAVAQNNGTTLTVATITVTPHVYHNGVEYDGQPISFKFTVHPKFTLETDNTVVMYPISLSTCPEAAAPEIELTVPVVENATYQWYKNDVMINMETRNVYRRTNVTSVDSGDYYCIITARCGSARSNIFRVVVTEIANDVLVEQLWNDVLQVNCIQSENGGFTYTTFNWYYSANGVKTGAVSYADGLSWIRVASGDLGKTFVVEATDATGKVHVSCEVTLIAGTNRIFMSAYPSPAEQGSEVKVSVSGILEGTIQLISNTGNVVSVTSFNGSETSVRMPNAAGIYIMRAIPVTNDGTTAEVKVIVK